MKQFLSKLPKGLLTLFTVLAILWLTLAPKPLGEEPPSLFPGADKLAHAIMFGGLTLMMLLDRQRKDMWRKVIPGIAVLIALTSSIFGIAIEFLQNIMGLGRGLEIEDMEADTIGSFFFMALWLFFQNSWSKRT